MKRALMLAVVTLPAYMWIVFAGAELTGHPAPATSAGEAVALLAISAAAIVTAYGSESRRETK